MCYYKKSILCSVGRLFYLYGVFIYLFSGKLYMHRTCSARMTHFKIMMIDGVCRSERTGNGYLCMCGKHLCNGTGKYRPSAYNFFVLSAFFLLKQTTLGGNS